MNLHELAKRLHMRFLTFWGEKFARNFKDESLIEMWIEDWAEGICVFEPKNIKDALDYCKFNLEWPPSLSEFIKICERSRGILDADEAFELARQRILDNDLISYVFCLINDSEYRMGTLEENKKRFVNLYTKTIQEKRMENFNKYKSLEKQNLQIVHDSSCKQNISSSDGDVSFGNILSINRKIDAM